MRDAVSSCLAWRIAASLSGPGGSSSADSRKRTASSAHRSSRVSTCLKRRRLLMTVQPRCERNLYSINAKRGVEFCSLIYRAGRKTHICPSTVLYYHSRIGTNRNVLFIRRRQGWPKTAHKSVTALRQLLERTHGNSPVGPSVALAGDRCGLLIFPRGRDPSLRDTSQMRSRLSKARRNHLTDRAGLEAKNRRNSLKPV